MWNRLTLNLLKRMRIRESWIIFFILGIIMMNYPFLQTFNKHELLLGISPLFLYLYIGWFISIMVIYIFTKAIDLPDDDSNHGDDH